MPGIQPLASAVYVAGTSPLEPGRRYDLVVGESRLQVLGPLDIDPTNVVLDRPIATCDAKAVEGRLVISGAEGRSAFVLAFMSVAGPATGDVAEAIRTAARASVRT